MTQPPTPQPADSPTATVDHPQIDKSTVWKLAPLLTGGHAVTVYFIYAALRLRSIKFAVFAGFYLLASMSIMATAFLAGFYSNGNVPTPYIFVVGPTAVIFLLLVGTVHVSWTHKEVFSSPTLRQQRAARAAEATTASAPNWGRHTGTSNQVGGHPEVGATYAQQSRNRRDY